MANSISLVDLVADRLSNRIARLMRSRAAKRGRLFGIAAPMDDSIGIRLFSTGSFEQTQTDGVLNFLDAHPPAEDAVFLDVGANIGVYSILLARFFAKAYAFEPNPVTYRYLASNLEMAGAGTVSPVNAGLSSSSGPSKIYVPVNGNLGWATVDPNHLDMPVRERNIELKTLDEFMETEGLEASRIGLVKIDVEGHEIDVIRGGIKTIESARPPLLCEVLPGGKGAPLVALLRDLGYSEFSRFKRDYSNPFATKVVRAVFDPDVEARDHLMLAR